LRQLRLRGCLRPGRLWGAGKQRHHGGGEERITLLDGGLHDLLSALLCLIGLRRSNPVAAAPAAFLFYKAAKGRVFWWIWEWENFPLIVGCAIKGPRESLC